MKNILRIVLVISFMVLPSCGRSSRVSVDPWPGLVRLKESNKQGYKSQKKRDKKLKKLQKKRQRSD